MASFGWSAREIAELKRLHSRGDLFMTEIAAKLGRRPASVRWKAHELGLVPTRKQPAVAARMGQWNAKHLHLREAVLTYFLTHSMKETQEHFGLTPAETKSLFSVAYKMPEFKHLRKETRDHSSWSTKQLLFLLRHAGLRNRKWIVAKLGRGASVHIVKDRLGALGIASRNLQGLTLSQYTQAFGDRPAFHLVTDCGPTRGSGHHGMAGTLWKIIPWVWLEAELRAGRLKTARELRLLISARAMFQEWIFEGDALRKMKRICAAAGKE